MAKKKGDDGEERPVKKTRGRKPPPEPEPEEGAPPVADLATVVVKNGVERMHLSPHPGQAKALASPARFVSVIAGSQGGKAIYIDTLIPTPGGLVPMGEIREGMQVFGRDGSAVKVIAESQIFFNHRCWELSFDGGERIVADREHLWPIGNGAGVLLTTEQLAFNMEHGLKPWMIGAGGQSYRYVESIREVASVPTKCIAVDSEDHLYLCGESRIPTHNTVTGPVWLFFEMRRKGRGDYLVVSPTFTLLELKALPAFIKFFDKQMHLGKYTQTPIRRFVFSEAGERAIFGDYDPHNPTTVYFAYAEDPESLESMTSKAAWLDEAGQKKFKLGSWQAILRRLAVNKGRALITTTPYDFGWLKKEVFDRYAAGEQDYDVINFKSTDNPAFSQEEYERARASMPPWQFDLFHNGIFRRAAGLVYDSFDKGLCWRPRFEIPLMWDRYIGIDFGGVNTAAVFFAEEPFTNKLYLYRAYKSGGRTAVQHCHYIQQGEPEFRLIVGGARNEGQWRQEFRTGGKFGEIEVEGLNIRKPRIADVKLGINRLWGTFNRNEIIIFDDLEDVMNELEDYSWVLDSDQQPTGEIDDKGRYHAMDACRYVISNIRGPNYEVDQAVTSEVKAIQDQTTKEDDEKRRADIAARAVQEREDRIKRRWEENDALDRAAQNDPFDQRWWPTMSS